MIQIPIDKNSKYMVLIIDTLDHWILFRSLGFRILDLISDASDKNFSH